MLPFQIYKQNQGKASYLERCIAFYNGKSSIDKTYYSWHACLFLPCLFVAGEVVVSAWSMDQEFFVEWRYFFTESLYCFLANYWLTLWVQRSWHAFYYESLIFHLVGISYHIILNGLKYLSVVTSSWESLSLITLLLVCVVWHQTPYSYCDGGFFVAGW